MKSGKDHREEFDLGQEKTETANNIGSGACAGGKDDQ